MNRATADFWCPPTARTPPDDAQRRSIDSGNGNASGASPVDAVNGAAAGNPADNGAGDPNLRRAVVEFISPSADPSSGLVRVSLRYTNDGHQVRAGTRVTAYVPTP